jgi:hypothetical protein
VESSVKVLYHDVSRYSGRRAKCRVILFNWVTALVLFRPTFLRRKAMSRCIKAALFVAAVLAGVGLAGAEPLYHLTDLGSGVSWGALLEFQPNGQIGGLDGNWIAYPQFITGPEDLDGNTVFIAGTALGWEDLPRGVSSTPSPIATVQGTRADVFAVLYGGMGGYGGDKVGEFLAGPNSGDALFVSNGQFLDLNDLVDFSAAGWRLERADSLGFAALSTGEIVGLGRAPDGSLHGFLLTPAVQPGGSGPLGASAIPEPTSVALLVLGTLALGIWRTRLARSR